MKKTIIYSALLSLMLIGCGEDSNSSNNDVKNVLPKKYTTLSKSEMFETTTDYLNATPEPNLEDWYKITFDDIGSYAFYGKTLDGTKESGRLKFTLYNNKGIEYKTIYSENLVLSNIKSDIIDNINIVEKGDYYLKVNRIRLSSIEKTIDIQTKYSFYMKPSIENNLIQDEDGEYNDFQFMATPITLSDLRETITDSVFLTRSNDFEDFYKVYLNLGDYAIYLNVQEGTSDHSSKAEINIYNEAGINVKTIYSNYLVGRFILQNIKEAFKADESEFYYIGVKRTVPLVLKYDLKVLPSNNNLLNENKDGEYNDFRFMATKLTNNQIKNGYSNSINRTNPNDYEDWYSFDLEKGNYNLNTKILENTKDDQYSAFFIITDDKGIPITSLTTGAFHSLNIGTEKNKDFSITKKGTYFINVFRGRALTNDYSYSTTPMDFNFSIK